MDSLAPSYGTHPSSCASRPRGRGQVPQHGDDFMAVEASGAAGICGLVLSNLRSHSYLWYPHPGWPQGCGVRRNSAGEIAQAW